MFAGIGGLRAGLTRAGGFSCIGHSEIDKYAEASYQAIHHIQESEVYYPDARTIEPNTMPDFDLLCGGFPCQSFSIAGRRRGFEDARGTLFFELARIAAAKRPRYLLFENVPGLLSHDQGKTFSVILQTLCELGYGVEWAVLNSKDYGVPQSRRRVFLVGYLDRRCAGKILPYGETNQKALIQITGKSQSSRVYDTKGLACTQTASAGGAGLYLVRFNHREGITGKPNYERTLGASDFRGLNRNQTQNAIFVDMTFGHPKVTKLARCLTAHYAKSSMSAYSAEKSGVLECQSAGNEKKDITFCIKEGTKQGFIEVYEGDTVRLSYAGNNTRRGRVGRNIAHTLDTSSSQGVVKYGRIRRLTPKECFRLQGFDDSQIDRILSITSDAQAYKQAGNAVTVNVIEAIGRRILDIDRALQGGES